MNKTELIAAVAEKAQLSKKDTEAVLEALTAAITEILAKGDKIQLIGFGAFEPHVRDARTARNPRTGEQIEVPATVVPVFKPGKAFKDALNQ